MSDCIESVCSQDSVENVTKLERLNSFLSEANSSPVSQLRKKISVSDRRTQNRYKDKAEKVVKLVMDVMCPGEGELLWDSVLKSAKSETTSSSPDSHTYILAEIYQNVETWRSKDRCSPLLHRKHHLKLRRM